MSPADCERFLQWALPQIGWRLRGFRNVRGQVCKRISRRIRELGLPDVEAYRARLSADREEWRVLDGLCGVTISRFYRDHEMWDALRDDVLPALAAAAEHEGEQVLRCWSAGCASGEEPYTLAILWRLALAQRFPRLRLHVLATDFDDRVLRRAKEGVYASATLGELPSGWREESFERQGDQYRLRNAFRVLVALRRSDLRAEQPDGPFHLILCRNLVFTYFDEALQLQMIGRMTARLSTGGAFVVGRGEFLPQGAPLVPWLPAFGIYRQASMPAGAGLAGGPAT